MRKMILCVVIGLLYYIPMLMAEPQPLQDKLRPDQSVGEEAKNHELDARIAKLVKQL
ncbi:MAG: hypothetical protein HY762_00305, partial [Planctomycetes bacterium]|nr:hypothetical protein [Planctomycetota bacterium]